MYSSSGELEEARWKVREWKRDVLQEPAVYLRDGVDLTLPPSAGCGCPPAMTPYQILRSNDILGSLVSIPSITHTSFVSAAVGCVVALILTKGNASVQPQRLWRRLLSRIIRLALATSTLFFYFGFLRSRYPSVRRVSEYHNLSDSSTSSCYVAQEVLQRTSSQAGTHADSPQYCGRSLLQYRLDDAHYSGAVVVLDVSPELSDCTSGNAKVITTEVMQKACERLPAGYRDGSTKLWRLLLVSRRASSEWLSTVQATWDKHHAYLDPEAVHYLNQRFPFLLLVGIDTPSVDAASVRQPFEHSHGALLRCGMAVLENLKCTSLEAYLQQGTDGVPGCVVGSLLTVFNPTQCFDDARGCCVMFFPSVVN